MAANSKIEWTTHTFNPWRGCTKVSAGCANCYAETLSGRNPKTLGVWGPNGTRVVAAESTWREPVKWNRDAAKAGTRPRVFCASLADVFEDWAGPMVDAQGHRLNWVAGLGRIPWIGGSDTERPANVTMADVRRRLFALIDATPNLDWILLTKRPENIARMLPDYTQRSPGMSATFRGFSVARPNVWLGTSVESQQAADERIPHLLRVPAAVRFLSCEPLLGPVDLRQIVLRRDGERGNELSNRLGDWVSPLTGAFTDSPRIHWCIVGGESGPGARPLHPDWVRSLRDQCQAAGVPFFFKQWGEWEVATGGGSIQPGNVWLDAEGKTSYPSSHDVGPDAYCMRRVGKKAAGRLLDGREWNEFPTVEAAGSLSDE